MVWSPVLVPLTVALSEAVNVLPSAMVKVAPVVGAVIVTLFKEVAEATPNVGVIKVGEVENTNVPEPVSSEITPFNSAEVVAERALILSVVYTPLVTVAALPFKVAVMVPAAKSPFASRATIAEAVLASVAVVAELLTFPEVAIVASFVSAIA